MLKKLQSNLWKLSLIIWVVMGSNALWGQTYTLDLGAQNSSFGTTNTYANKSGTVSNVTWYINSGSCQSASAVWLGANSAANRNSLEILSAGVNGRGGAIASALSTYTGSTITTSTVGYYAIVGANAITNVGSITAQAGATGNTAPTDFWCLYTTDGGTTYTVLDYKSSPSTDLVTFTPGSTIATAQYAFVFYSASYGTYRVPAFKFYAPTCTTPTLNTTNFGNKTVNNGDASFTQTITSNSSGAITYSSGTTSVATVNSSTGAVTIVAPGTSVITANQAANGSYCATSTTYTLTVNSTTPTVTASGTLAAVPTTYGTASSTTTFTASGANLTAPIIITAPNGYEISTASASGFGSSISLTPTSGTVSATTIYVRIAATTTVGSYSGNITLSSASTPAASTTIATVSSAVSAKALTITGLTGGSKVYDALLTAPVSGTATLNGVVNNDAITLSGTPAYNFTTKAVGTNSITVTGYTVTGTNAGSYTVTQPTSLTGTITAKSVTVTGATAQDKTYDGTATATISGGTIVGAITNDAVSVSTTGTFASTNAGSGIGVTIALTGNDATNYSLTQPGITATINKANPVFSTGNISVGVNSTYSLPGVVSSTSNGTLSYSITNTAIATLSGSTISGVAVGSTVLNVNQASSTNYNAGSTTYTLTVTTITYLVGDFRTKTGGTWTNKSTAVGTATWEKYTNTGWVDSVDASLNSVEPSGTAGNYTVYITQDTSIPTNATQNATPKIYVTNGATLTYLPSTQWTFVNLVIDSGATVDVSTLLRFSASGNFEIYDGGNFIYRYTANPGSGLTGSLWAGSEIFHPNSNFYVTNHATGSAKYFLPDDSYITSNTYNSFTAYFGNLIIDSTDEVRLTTTNFTGKNLTHGNLEFKPVAAYTMLYGSVTWTIGGNLVISQNSASSSGVNLTTNTTGTPTIVFNVKRDFINNSKNSFRLINNTSGTATLNIDGNITLSGEGKLDLSSNGTSVTNVKGDISVASGALLYATNTGATTNLNFTGTGNGSTAATTQTIDIATTAATKNQYLNFAAKSGSYVQLANNFTLGTSSKFTAEAGSVFDTQTNILSGPTFVTAATSTVTTANTDGLTGAIATTAATYTAGTHYIFNAATTTPFPTGTFGNPANVTTNANVTLNRTLAPTGSVTVNSGIFDLDAYTIDRATSGSTITLGSGTTLKINGTNGFPANYATQVFGTNSTVHFAGDSQPVKKLTAEYYNVRLSGTGTKTFDNETIVGNNLTLENGPSVTLAANKTLTVRNQVTNNGTENNFIIEDNGALVQTNNVANSGYITAHKNSNVLYRQDYTMWSAPTTGTQTIGSISPGTLETRFYEYDCRNSGSGYVEAYYHVNPATDTFTAGHSYLIRMPNVDTTPDYNTGGATLVIDGKFTGTPNNGTITRSLNTHADRFTSTGNPYPSPIGITEFFAANNTVLESGSGIYLWRKKNNGLTGSYATVSAISYAFNSSNGSTTGGQINDQYFNGTATSTWRIAPAQGFLVKTAASATGTPVVTFNNAMRKSAPSSGGQSFFRTGTQSISRYWINLIDNENSISQFTVAYAEDATNGIDYGYDAFRLGEANTFAAYTIAEEKDLTIQARPDFVISDQVKMGYIATQPGTYTLSLSNKDGIFADGQNIYIKDNQEGIIRELTGNGYAFGTEAGTFNERFTILYTNQVLDTDNPSIVNNNVTVFKNNSSIVADAGNDIINSIEVYDIQGRRIFANSNINASNYSINGLNASHEMLIVKVATNKGTVSKKIIF